MSSKNSTLLIVKQNPGIDYNSLVNKISANYGSINSARAAASRAIKNATAFGLAKREGNKIYLTMKGEATIYTEVKNKLILNLNDLIRSKNPVHDVDEIVKNLQTLIERSKADTALLKAAQNSVDFYLTDLKYINRSVEAHIKHLLYINRILADQLKALEDLNFSDKLKFDFNKKEFFKLVKLIKDSRTKDISLETKDKSLLKNLASEIGVNKKGSHLIVNEEQFNRIKESVLEEIEKGNEFIFYFSDLKIRISKEKISVLGPVKRLRKVSSQIQFS